MPKMIFSKGNVERIKLPPAPRQVDYFERLQSGRSLVLCCSYRGTKSWRVLFYMEGKACTLALGRYPEMPVKEARDAARKFDAEGELRTRQAGRFRDIAEKYIRYHVDENKLRSKREIERQLRVYIYPRWEDCRFLDIRRGVVNELLDHIADKHGKRQCDAVLATIRGIFN